MKRLHPFLIVTGIVGMAANLTAILINLSGSRTSARWRADPGLLLALSFIALAYSLVVWSTLACGWVGRRAAPDRRPPLFLLNGLAALPLLTLWLDLLFSLVLYTDVTSVQRWLLALAHAWVLTPFTALVLTRAGETLGPLLDRSP